MSYNNLSQILEEINYGPVWVKKASVESKSVNQAQPTVSAPTSPTAANTEIASLKDTKAEYLSQLSWQDLNETVKTCQRCHLCQTRTQVVFGVGNPQAKIMLIGEAPGEQEDLKGEPFVGKSGQLLDQMLKALNLDRSIDRGVYIANTLKCRPPDNRNPSAEELATCAPFLARQIQLINPQVMLAVGRFAIQWLMKTDELKESLSSLRGKVHSYQDGALKIPFIATYHPSYLLRNPAAKAQSWDDLCLLQDTIKNLPTQ
jgi:uracil-DNA glycosylase family 4